MTEQGPALRVTLLGTGAAGGVPMLSAGWGACDPNEPRNRRLRASILIEQGAKRLLVDTGPDVREQLLAANVRRLDGVLYTHAHADHTHGIDELREINRAMRGPLDIWGDEPTLHSLMSRFKYCFEGIDIETQPIFRPWLIPHLDPAMFHGWRNGREGLCARSRLGNLMGVPHRRVRLLNGRLEFRRSCLRCSGWRENMGSRLLDGHAAFHSCPCR